jgi:hypothetical protein
MDKMAKIWTYNKDKIEPLGTLRQGYMLKQIYVWNFPLGKYHNGLGKRQEGVQNMLDDLRRKRDEEKTLKKKKQQLQQMAGKAGATTLGFAGA